MDTLSTVDTLVELKPPDYSTTNPWGKLGEALPLQLVSGRSIQGAYSFSCVRTALPWPWSDMYGSWQCLRMVQVPLRSWTRLHSERLPGWNPDADHQLWFTQHVLRPLLCPCCPPQETKWCPNAERLICCVYLEQLKQNKCVIQSDDVSPPPPWLLKKLVQTKDVPSGGGQRKESGCSAGSLSLTLLFMFFWPG